MILAILQARLSSSRLPNKVLKSILGKPMLLHQVERTQHSKKIDKLVIATSDNVSDDAIEKMCLDNNIEVFRGDLNNVLDRFYQCTRSFKPDHVVRLTGDCPLADWQIIDNMIQCYLDKKLDYMATSLNFPDGLDVEVMTMKALAEAKYHATLPSELEHVTQYINKKNTKFKIEYFDFDKELSHLRWTVDEPEDFALVEKIYEALYEINPLFLTNDILDLLKRQPELTRINDSFIRNEGLEKSIQEDKVFLKNV
ncbi:glycosyltransferase family protein [bacterium]|jgi:spore coat polysaccharide biosynthesis protein SpsF (cytidylyltransferase family)|nr:glycosyltransferase family protein [bacterium]